jgi:ABC-type multidrug transport system ATPase subunit
MEIKLKHLTKTFPGNPNKHIPDTVAVSDLNIDIADGELLGLLGPSGCGKSTTLYMISGLKQPTEGEIWFGDEEVTHLAPGKTWHRSGLPELCPVSAYDRLRQCCLPLNQSAGRDRPDRKRSDGD